MGMGMVPAECGDDSPLLPSMSLDSFFAVFDEQVGVLGYTALLEL